MLFIYRYYIRVSLTIHVYNIIINYKDFEIEIDKHLSFYNMQRIEKIALNEKTKTSKVEYYQRIICD